MLLVLFGLVAVGLFLPTLRLVPTLAVLVFLILLGAAVLRAQRTRQASTAEEPQEDLEKGVCPTCESDISEIDDVCPHCGTIVAFETLWR
jgi:hypothetical protein